MDQRQEALGLLYKLHEMIDELAAPLNAQHSPRLQCKRGCFGCCTDDLTVFTIEAERIKQDYPELLAEAQPHAPGRCAFLDAHGACRIYDARPYVCRTQGLPLRWLEQEGDDVVEYRDICPLNVVEEAPLDTLPGEACWPIGPVEQKLASFQQAFEGELKRVALRDLFVRDNS